MTCATQTSEPQSQHRYPQRRTRRRLQQLWQDTRWFLIGGLWAAALAFGYIGFARHFASRGETRSPAHLLYLSLQLFTLESGAVSGAVGWPLELARWLAPAVAAYTALQTLALLYHEQMQLIRLRLFRDHTVICGLGRKGFRLAHGFRQRDEQVVVIEGDEQNKLIRAARSEGVVVLIGDATRPELLRRARVRTARRLIAVCGDDGTNAEIGVRCGQLVAHSGGTALTCILHVTNPQLCTLLREREMESGSMGRFRLEFFNVFDTGARALLNQHPPFGRASRSGPHALIIGLGHLGESVLVQMAMRWARRDGAPQRRLRMTVVDREAERKVESLCLRYPRLGEVCEIEPVPIDIGGPVFQRATFLFNGEGRCDVTIIIVCLDNDSLSLSTALALGQHLPGQDIPIIVRTEQDAGLAMLMEGTGRGDGGFKDVHAFALLDRTCTPEQLLSGTHEILARAIHRGYVSFQREVAEPSRAIPVAVPWEELPEAYRESSRRQADHIGEKLRAVGCSLAQLSDWNAEPLRFTREEVEMMARMEHERWMEERLGEGWQLGPRDDERKTSPYLVNWEELPEAVKELVRDMVRRLPRTLAQVGLQVVRIR